MSHAKGARLCKVRHIPPMFQLYLTKLFRNPARKAPYTPYMPYTPYTPYMPHKPDTPYTPYTPYTATPL